MSGKQERYRNPTGFNVQQTLKAPLSDLTVTIYMNLPEDLSCFLIIPKPASSQKEDMMKAIKFPSQQRLNLKSYKSNEFQS